MALSVCAGLYAQAEACTFKSGGDNVKLQEHPIGAVGPDEQLRTGDLLVLVWAGNHDGPRMATVEYVNREGGRVRPPDWKGWWHHLTRMCGPWAVFRVDPAHSGGHSTRNDPNAVAYLNELRRREAADLRARADKLLVMAGEVTT